MKDRKKKAAVNDQLKGETIEKKTQDNCVYKLM